MSMYEKPATMTNTWQDAGSRSTRIGGYGAAHAIVDMFEDLLYERKILVEDVDREFSTFDEASEAGEAMLYGCTYGDLLDKVRDCIRRECSDVKIITTDEALAIIKSSKPQGQYIYCDTATESWAAIDTRTGAVVWSEEFATQEEALDWLESRQWAQCTVPSSAPFGN